MEFVQKDAIREPENSIRSSLYSVHIKVWDTFWLAINAADINENQLYSNNITFN